MTDKDLKTTDSNNPELQTAQAFVQETDCHIFLTGKAGTGKTTFLKNLKTTTAKQMVVTAPTGVAAINAGGVTLHSFFQLPLGPFIPGSDGFMKNKDRIFRFSKEKKQIIKTLNLLVIDEVSMVRADVLDAVDAVLRRHRRNGLPFGGVQLLLIGDLYQLPPVVKSNEWGLLQQYYDSPYYFTSHALRRIDLISIELKKVYRQGDERFIRLLNKVRDNQLDESSFAQLNQRVDTGFRPKGNEGYITLTTHNRKADAINREMLNAIQGDVHHLEAEISGEFAEQVYPTFPRLSLKKGAQVMFLRNDTSAEKQYYNGKIGHVESVSAEAIHVKCPDDAETIRVEPVEWQNIKYTLNQVNQEIEEEVIGRFKQFPLKPAWAITIHKSQGLTFDKAVIDTGQAFAQGQVYVALSRCRTFQGLVLSSPVPRQGIEPDKAVSRFMDEIGHRTELNSQLLQKKITYQQRLLIDCFDFQGLSNRLRYLAGLILGNPGLIQVSGITDLNRIQTSFHEDIIRVSENFKRQLMQNFTNDSLPEEDHYIRDRVQKASQWFEARLAENFNDLIKNLVAETDNQALEKKIGNAFGHLKLDLAIKQSVIKSCAKGFSPSQCLRAASKAQIEFSPAKPVKKQTISYTASDISHPQLFAQLREWRLNLAREKGVPAFHILHQQVLIQIVIHMPADLNALKAIKGIGPKTAENYGNDILAMVLSYREEHGIEKDILPEKKESPTPLPPKKQKKGETKKISVEFFKQGLSIKEIAEKRGLSENTIQGHLEHYLKNGDLNIDQLLSSEKQARIKAIVSNRKDMSLKSIKADLGDTFSYGDIKLMMAHLTGQDSKKGDQPGKEETKSNQHQ